MIFLSVALGLVALVVGVRVWLQRRHGYMTLHNGKRMYLADIQRDRNSIRKHL